MLRFEGFSPIHLEYMSRKGNGAMKTRDWKWLVGILVGTNLLILSAWIMKIPDVGAYLSILGTGVSIALALIAIYISLSQNNNSQILNVNTMDVLARIDEKVRNVNEKVDKFDSKEIAEIIETRVSKVLKNYSKDIFDTLEKAGIDHEKIESVKVAVPVEKALIPKIAKISITTSVISYSHTDEDAIGHATYAIYDQYGNDVTTGSPLNDNLTFKSQVGIATGNNGLLTVRDLKGAYLKQIGTVIITIEDTTTGVSASAPLRVVDNSSFLK
jgi:hypothetical protein